MTTEPSTVAAPGRSLRVLMIAPTSFFGDYGCHVRILEEIRALQSRGHRVALVTYHMGRDLLEVDIRRTMAIPLRGDYEVGSSRHKVAFDMLLFGRAFRAMVRFRPDIIHGHLHEGGLIGWALSKLSGKPLVFDYQGSLTGEMSDHGFLRPEGRWYKAMKRLERQIDHLAPEIVTSSGRASQQLCESFGCDPERITELPDCVNIEAFAPATRNDAWRALRRAYGVPAGRRVVVYLGLLATHQGIDHLLEAARRIRAQRDDVHWLIGGYPNVEHYADQARQLGLANCTSFAGKVPYEQAPRFMGLGDVAVSPKLSRTEGAGKLLNYMALALPTVSFDSAVSREYLGDLGLYAEFGSVEDLAAKLALALDDTALCASLGPALRARAKAHFSWDHSGDLLLQAYDRLLG